MPKAKKVTKPIEKKTEETKVEEPKVVEVKKVEAKVVEVKPEIKPLKFKVMMRKPTGTAFGHFPSGKWIGGVTEDQLAILRSTRNLIKFEEI